MMRGSFTLRFNVNHLRTFQEPLTAIQSLGAILIAVGLGC
jgi:hypothetical protein